MATYKFMLSGAQYRKHDSGDFSSNPPVQTAKDMYIEYTTAEDGGTDSYTLKMYNGAGTLTEYAFVRTADIHNYMILVPKSNQSSLIEGGDYTAVGIDEVISATAGANGTVNVKLGEGFLYRDNGSTSITITPQEEGDTNTYTLGILNFVPESLKSVDETRWTAQATTIGSGTDTTAGTMYTATVNASAGWMENPVAANALVYTNSNTGTLYLDSSAFAENAFTTTASGVASLYSTNYVHFLNRGAYLSNGLFSTVDVEYSWPGSQSYGISAVSLSADVTLSGKVARHFDTLATAGNFVFKDDAITAGLKKSSIASNGGKIKYISASGGAELFTLSGFGGDVVLDSITSDVSDVSGGYRVSLSSDVLNAAAAAAATNEGSMSTISVAKGTATYSVELSIPSTVATARTSTVSSIVAAIQNDQSLTAVTGKNNKFTYTSTSYKPYYELGGAAGSSVNNAITVHAAEAGKIFDVGGLASTATASLIGYSKVESQAATDSAASVPAHYLFTIGDAALAGKDITISRISLASGDTDTTAVWASLSSSVARADTKIFESVSAANGVFMYQASGFGAGYVTAQDLNSTATTEGAFGENIHAGGASAVVLYANQRNGETFTLTGLTATALSTVRTAVTEAASVVTGTTITAPTGVTIGTANGGGNDRNVTIDSSAIGYVNNIVLTRTDVYGDDDTAFEKKDTVTAYNNYKLTLDTTSTNSVRAIDAGPLTVSSAGYDNYGAAYVAAFNTAAASQLAGVDYYKTTAKFTTVAAGTSSNNYTYTSSYSRSFYTKQQDYDTLASTFATSDKSFDSLSGYMSADGQDVYRLTNEGTYLSKHSFTISGLSTALNATSVGEIRNDNKVLGSLGAAVLGESLNTSTYTVDGASVASDKAVVIDYTNYNVIINRAALPTSLTPGSTTISLSGNFDYDGDSSTTDDIFKLSFGKGAAVESIGYGVTESVNSETDTSTYTVILKGTTAGFAANDSNKAAYTYQAQTGGQVFEIKGLKSGLTTNQITESMFVHDTTTSAFTFNISDDLLKRFGGQYNYNDNEQITIEYKGTWDGSTINAAAANDTVTSVAFGTGTVNSDFTLHDSNADKDAYWTTVAADNSTSAQAGSFSYITEKTGYTWTDAADSLNGTQKDTLTFTKAFGGDTLATFTGLTGITDVNALASVVPVYSDAAGKAYSTVAASVIKAGESSVTAAIQYKDSNDSVMATFDSITGERITSVSGGQAVGNTDLFNYVFQMPAGAGDTTAEGGFNVTYKPGFPTNSLAPYYATSMHVAFGKDDSAAGVTTYMPAVYDAQSTVTSFASVSSDTTGKTYEFVAPHIPEYYKGSASVTAITATLGTGESSQVSTLADLRNNVATATTENLATAQSALYNAVTLAAATAASTDAVNYSHSAASGAYGFTINGLPTGIASTAAATYFSFEAPSSTNGAVATVTLNAAAFKNGDNYVDGQTIRLTNINLDGNLDGKTDQFTITSGGTTSTVDAKLKLAIGDTDPATVRTVATVDGTAAVATLSTETTGTVATSASYTYKTASYQAWYELDNEYGTTTESGTVDDEISATYHASTTGSNFFTISGLAYKSGENPTALVEYDTTVNGGTIKSGSVYYDIDKNVVTVYKDALAGQNVSIGAASSTVTAALPLLDFFTLGEYNEKYNAITVEADKTAYENAWRNHAVATNLKEATHNASLETVQGDGSYKFTAGYIEAYYTQASVGGAASVTAQEGSPDVITLSGLKKDLLKGVKAEDISIVKEAGTGDNKGKTVYTISIPGTGDAKTELFKVVYTPATPADIEEGIDAVNAKYSVILQDGALAEDPSTVASSVTTITAAINTDSPEGSDTSATAVLSLSDISSASSLGAASLGAADSVNTRTYITGAGTEGYILGTGDTVATYTASAQQTFTIKGLNSSVTAADITYTTANSNKNFAIKPTALNGEDIVIKQNNATTNISASIVGTAGTDYADGTKATAATLSSITANGFTFTAEGYQAGYMTAAESTAGSGTYAAGLGAHTDAAILYVGKRHGETVTLNGLKLDTTKISLGAATDTNTDGIINDSELAAAFTAGSGVTLDSANHKFTVDASVLGANSITLTYPTSTTGYETGTTANSTVATYALSPYDLNIAGSDDVKAIAVTVQTPLEPGKSFVDTYASLFSAAKETVLTAAGTDITTAASFATVTSTPQNATNATYNYASSYDKAYFTKLPTYDANAAQMMSLLGDNSNKLFGKYMANEGQVLYTYNPKAAQTTFSISGLAPTLTADNLQEIKLAGTAVDTTKAVVVDYTGSKVAVSINSADALPAAANRIGVSLTGAAVDSVAASGYTLTFGSELTSGDNEILSENVTFGVTEDASVSGTYTVTLAGKTPGYVKNSDGTGYTYQTLEGGQRYTIEGLKTGLASSLETALANASVVSAGSGTSTITVPILQSYLKDSYPAGDNAIKLTYLGQVNNTTAHGGADSVAADNSTQFAFNIASIGHANAGTASVAHWAAESNITVGSGTESGFVFYDSKSPDTITPGVWDSTNNTIGLNYASATGGEALIKLTGLTSGTAITQLQENSYDNLEETKGKTIANLDSNDTDYNVAYKIASIGFVPCDANGNPYTLMVAERYNGTEFVKKVVYYDSEGKEVTGNSITNFLLDLPDGTFPTLATGVKYQASTASNGDFQGKTISLSFGGIPSASTPHTVGAAVESVSGSEGTYDITSKYYAEYYQATTNSSGFTTYSHVDSVGKYSYTISGLPASITSSNLGTYLTNSDDSASSTITAHKVTLTTEAFNTGNYADGATIIELTNIDADGNGVVDTEQQGYGSATTSHNVKLVMPAQTDAFKTEKTQKTAPQFQEFAAGSDTVPTTYKYTTTGYKKYYTLDPETSSKVTYHAEVNAYDLFRISGVSNTATISGTGANIIVDEPTGKVTLYNTALDDKDITFTVMQDKTASLSLYDKSAYDAGYAASTNKAQYKTDHENLIVTTDATKKHHPASVDSSAAANGTYTFTAGYTDEYYTANGTGYKFTPQAGKPDVIALSGLKQNLALTVADDENGGYTFTDASGNTVLTVKYHEKESSDKAATAGINESTNRYEVILNDAAIADTHGNIGVTINSGNPTGADTTATAYFNIDSLSSANVPTDATATLAAAGDDGTRTYTSTGKTEGYDFTTAGQLTSLAWQTPTQKTFTITGLTADATADNISYVNNPAVGTTAESHAFTIASAALDNKNNILIKQGSSAANITATISGDYAKGTDAIPQSVTVSGSALTYTNTGNKAGYLTPAEATAATIPNTDDAQFVYSEQRGGEQFKVTGLNSAALTVIGQSTYTIPAAVNNVITFTDGEATPTTYFTLNTKDNAVTLAKAALDTVDVTFTNESGGKYTVVLDSDGDDKVAQIAPTVTVNTSSWGTGTKFAGNYKTAFETAATTLAAADNDIQQKATLTKDSTTATTATSAVYNYKSSYTTEYFTKLPTYDATAAALANAGGANAFSQLENICMAASGSTVYKYKPATTANAFSIAGLSTTDVSKNFEEVTTADGTSDKAIVVNTANKTVTISDANVLAKADTVSLSGDGASGYTLDFAESLKSGANDILSETITYSVAEDTVTSGKYTVTLGGNTAGYGGNTAGYDSNKTWQAQTGGQVFTITGLKSSLSTEDITANMFVAESVDGAATGNFTFKVSNALLDDKDVSVTLSGTVVDVASGTETQDSIKANTDKTVVIDKSAVTVASATDEAWSKEDSGAFVFTTAKTEAKWTPGEAGKNTTLTYVSPAGGDTLISLSGLTASSYTEMPTPVYADENGALLCEVKSTSIDSDNKVYNVESWYKAEDVTKKADGVTYEAKDNTTPVVKIMTNTNNASDVITDKDNLKAYRFDLKESTFDASAMVTNGVTYKANPATDNTFKGKEVFIAFNGELPRENAPAETPETLTPATGEDGKAVSGSYKYVSEHTDAYYKSTDDKDDTSVKTYNFVRAIDEYGFTINGLPANTDTGKISNYFTFKEADTNAKAFNVTLTEAAFGDADTTKSGAVISLTNIDLDGDNDNKDDATIALVMPEDSNTFNTETAEVETKANLTTTDTTAATATYTYNATKYKGFYALADDSHSVNYTTARGGDALFKLDGLSTSNTYSALPGYNQTTGDLEYASRVIVNEGDDGNYTVMLTKAAFNGQDIKLTAVDSSKTYTLALYNESEYAAAKDNFKAVFNENLVATSDSTHNKGKFVEGTNGYTFTAGYTPAYYGISGDTASYHDQVGHADEIQISNLAEGLAGEDYTFTDDGNGNYTVKKGDTTVLEIVYTAVEENDAAEAYTVKLYDGALPTEGEDIELVITAAEDRGSAASAPAAAFDVAALKTPTDIFGSFTYTAADEEKEKPAYYTFTAEGTTDGYTLNKEDPTKVNYHEKVRCATFKLEGITDGLAIAAKDTTQDNDVIKQLKTKGIDIAKDADSTDKFTVTLSEGVLANADIKLTDDENNYTLALAEGIYTDDKAATEEGKFSAVNNGTATYTTEKINKWYEKSGQANEYTFHGERGGAPFDIKGLATDDVTKERLLNTVAEGETAPIAIKETGVDGNDDITVTVTFNDTSIFGKGTIEFGTIPEGYEISMEVSDEVTGDVKVADNREEVAKDGAWDVTSIADGNATFKAGGFDAYYQKTYDKDEEGKDTTDLKSLTYFAEVPSTAQFALAGLNASLDAANLDNGIAFNDDEEDAKTVTINDKIGGENGATITSNIGGYSIIVSSTDKITGTENNDFFTISEGATVDGGKGDDTFKGDGGTIVFSEGKDTVDYAKGIKIQIDGNYSYEFTGKTADDGTVSDGDVILKRDNNTLTIKNAGGEIVTFVDSAGNETAVSFDQDLSKVFNFNSANPPTAVTVTSDFTGDEVGPNHFAIKDASNSIITIDASAVENGLKITGTGNTKNVIIGTENDDTLDPGISEKISVSSNTFTGDKGSDLFIYRGGDLTINDFNTNEEEDTLQIATDAASIESIDIKSGNITFDLSDGKKIALANALTASVTAVAIQDSDGSALSNNNYYSTGIIEDEDGTAVTLTASYNNNKLYEAEADIQDITAYNTTAIKIDASKTTKGVDINATAAANTLLGGAGSDTFTGATGKADLFVYDGRGADEVTNFEAADKVSLTGVDMSNITAVSVTADNEETAATDESAVKLSFGGTNSLNLKGAKDTVTVNGTAYIFEDNAYLDTKKTGITLTSGSKGTFDASGEAYSSVVSIDASAVTSTFSIAGNAKDNVITAGNSLGGHIFGDEGKDLFVFNGGFATILDYSAEDKDSISVASGLTYNQCTFSNNGKDVILTYLNSDSTTSNLTIVNGADQQITFVDDKKKASQSLFSALGQFNDNNTAVTLNAGVTEFNAQEKSAAYPKLATIVASSVTGAAVITANDKNKSTLTNAGNTHGNISLIGGAANDMLIAGEGGDYLDGGKGNDTVSVSGGTDTVVIGAGGTDTVKGFNATKDVFAYATVDSVKANITDAVIATKSGKSNLTLTLDNDSKVVVEDIGNGEALDSISVTIDGQANTFGKDFIGKGTEITLTSAFKGTVEQSASGRTSTVKSYTAASNITKVDASATSGGFTLQGGANNVELIGGKGADVLNADTTGAAANKLTGGAGNDVFVYSGGNDTITDFGNGSDKISLSGAFAMSKLSAVKFTQDEEEGSKGGTYALGFGENNTLNVYVEDATKTKTITIADSNDTKGAAYTFPANGGSFSVGKEITLLGGGDSISLADEAYKDYKSVAVQGAATVTAQEKKGGNIKLLSGGQAIGNNAADTLAALGGETTLTGSQANDLFIYNGGNAVITDYSEKNGARNDDTAKKLGADKVSLGSAVSSAITGIATVEGGFKLSFTPDDAEANTNSLTFQGINSSTKVDLTTTTEVNGKLKATKTKAYFSDGAILDNSVEAKAKSAIVAGSSNFSSLTGEGKNAKEVYAALVTITSANTATITGNSKNNVITLENGGSVKGGIGNDTYIIGGAATIGDFGIGATTITDQTDGVHKLPTKVNTVANTSKASIIAYSPEVGGYAEGKDKVQVDGTIISADVKDITKAVKADKTTKTDTSNSFSVTLYVDGDGDSKYTADNTADFTVLLDGILRPGKYDKTSGVGVNSNIDYKDLNTLQILELNKKGKYTKVKWDDLVARSGDSDEPSFDSASLDEIMDVTPAVTTGDSGTTKDADSFIITGNGDDSSDLTSKQK